MYFAASANPLGAVVGLTLSLFWGLVSIGQSALQSGGRATQAQMQDHVVRDTLDYLLYEAKCTSAQGERHRDWSELVDRIHVLASKALEPSSKRS